MWWIISDEDLRALLARAAAGEDAEMIHLEAYANSEGREVDPNG